MDPKTRLQQEPALRPLRRFEVFWSLLRYGLRTRAGQVVITVAGIAVILLAVLSSSSLRTPWHSPGLPSARSAAVGPQPPSPPLPTTPSSHPTNDWPGWLGNIQSLLGPFTLLIALFVWFSELCEDWENDLPLRMNVYFFHAGQPAIVCRHVWLAGAEDLRAWGQQVGGQAVGERLDFSSDVQARPPVIVLQPDGRVAKLCAVCFHLTKLPMPMAAAPGGCRYQNLLAANAEIRLEPTTAVASLPDVAAWNSLNN